MCNVAAGTARPAEAPCNFSDGNCKFHPMLFNHYEKINKVKNGSPIKESYKASTTVPSPKQDKTIKIIKEFSEIKPVTNHATQRPSLFDQSMTSTLPRPPATAYNTTQSRFGGKREQGPKTSHAQTRRRNITLNEQMFPDMSQLNTEKQLSVNQEFSH